MFYQENSFVSSTSRRFSDKWFIKKIPLLAVLVEDSLINVFIKKIHLLAVLVEDSLINVLTRKFLC